MTYLSPPQKGKSTGEWLLTLPLHVQSYGRLPNSLSFLSLPTLTARSKAVVTAKPATGIGEPCSFRGKSAAPQPLERGKPGVAFSHSASF